MGKENFLLLSLNDSKAKKVANVVSNESCRKILDYLTEKEATESKIAKELKLPLSTVHYNLEQLKKVGLVTWDKYHYSEKGKEVRHYKLVNKYIIIAPKDDPSFLEKLKGLFPAFLFSVLGAGAIALVSRFSSQNEMSSLAAQSMIVEEEAFADTAMLKSAPAQETIVQESFTIDPALWFFFGALFALVILLAWSYLRRKK